MLDGGAVEALEGWETATASQTLMKQPAVLVLTPRRDWQDSPKVKHVNVNSKQSVIILLSPLT